MSFYADAARSTGDAFKRGFSAFDKPGADIEVSPFAPGQVSGAAGVLKVLTAIASRRRAEANFAEEKKTKDASRYRQALEVKALEDRVNAPRYSFGGVDGLTGPEYLQAKDRADDNERALHPPQDPNDFISPSAADISDFPGLTPDAEGKVPLSVYRAAGASWGRRQAANNARNRTAAAGTTNHYRLSFAQGRIKALDAELAQEQAAAELRVRPDLDNAMRVFSEPVGGRSHNQEADLQARRAAAAKLLGLPSWQDQNGQTQFVTDASTVRAAYDRAIAKARGEGRAAAWQRQAPERAGYNLMFSQGSGVDIPEAAEPDAGDATEQALMEWVNSQRGGK